MTEDCSHSDTWFNRTFCAEPCGQLHDVCVDCGHAFDCYFNSDLFREAEAERRLNRKSRLVKMIEADLPVADRVDQIMAEFGDE